MGAGTQATLVFKEQMGLLAGEMKRVQEEIDKIDHEKALKTDALYRVTTDYGELRKELNQLTLAQVNLAAKTALGDIAAEEAAFANGMLAERVKEVREAMRGVIPEFTKQFEELQKNVQESVTATETNMKLYNALLATGAGAAEAAAAFDLLNLKITDLPSGDQLPTLSAMVDKDITSLKERQALLDQFAPGKSKQEIEAARSALGLSAPKKAELSVTEELVKRYKDQNSELAELQAALGNVSVLAEQAGVSQEFMTMKIQESIENLEVYKDRAKTLAEMIADGFKKASESLADNLADAIVEGKSLLDVLKNSFKQALKNILSSILQSGIQKAMAGLFGGFGGGGGMFGSMFGGGGGMLGGLLGGLGGFFGIPGLAKGGATNPSKGYIVGEKGPEFFMPGTTGRVIPNDEMGGASQSPVVNFNINAIDTQTGTEFILKNKKQIEGVVNEAYHRRGKVGIV
jgi:hypothetical protein